MASWETTCDKYYPGQTIQIGYAAGVPFDPSAGLEARYRFVSLASGAATVKRGGLYFPIRAPAFLCLDERESVELECDAPDGLTVLYFHPRVLASGLDFFDVRRNVFGPPERLGYNEYWLLPFVIREKPADGIFVPGVGLAGEIKRILAAIARELDDKETGFWACRARSFLVELLQAVVNAFANGTLGALVYEGTGDWLVSRLYDEIGKRYREHLTVDELAKELGTNRTTLQNRVSEVTGMTVAECIAHYRLGMARSLIAGTRLQFGEIAIMSGYADASSFSRAFKELYSVPPSDYRKLYGDYSGD